MAIYGDFPEEYTREETAKIVLLPVPYDGTTTWMKGAENGPQAIIEASSNMSFYDIETGTTVFEQGIYTAPAITEESSPDDMVEASYLAVRNYINSGKFVVTIGGEHSVTNGPVQAHFERYAGLTVLQFDAHADLRQEYEGSKYNHACVMSRVKEICPIVQVGIRSISKEETENVVPENMFWAYQIKHQKDWKERVLSRLGENVYITIDLDVFDPSIMPSTGASEPGGLQWYDVVDMVRLVVEHKTLVGFDVVELCPREDNKTPDFFAAKLIYQILSYKFALGKTVK